MEDDLILKQPLDRRLGNTNALPPGPPGAEFDIVDYVDIKNAPKKLCEREPISSKPSRRRRSPSYSPPPASKRRSPIRGRRTPSPRRSRYYSPERRRYDGGRSRRSPPDRRRSPRRMGYRDRFRGRGRSDSRSRSRSPTPRRNSRWSPKRKPHSPPSPPPPPPPIVTSLDASNIIQRAPVQDPQAQYMATQMYGGGVPFNQYNVPPPQTGYAVAQNEAYNMQTPVAATGYNTAYPPPPNWNNVNESQFGTEPQWMPQEATQIQQQVVQTTAPPNVLSDAAPGTVEIGPVQDAIAQEAFRRDELRKQRVSCFKKVAMLKTELNLLRDNRKDLCATKGPLSPISKGFLDENDKLQGTIMKKLDTIEHVIEMLTGVLGDDGSSDRALVDAIEMEEAEKQKQRGGKKNGDSTTGGKKQQKLKRTQSSTSSESSSSSTDASSSDSGTSSSSDEEEEVENNNGDDSPKQHQRINMNVNPPAPTKANIAKAQLNKAVPTPPPSVQSKQVQLKQEKLVEEKKRYNFVFYDPEMHWCQTCDAFPKTAKDFLNHLHSKEHMDREAIDTPWHSKMTSDQYPIYENVPTKRTPIRGLTFFAPATAWYCKLCNVWMGDLHCASTHLKSQSHSHKYNNFLEKNPHFEVNWLADRQRVLNEKKSAPLPPQITSVSTTGGAKKSKKSKRDDDDKSGKKRKKKSSDKKDKKKKKKSSKKRKKAAAAAASSSSSSNESESEDSEPARLAKDIVVKELNNPNPTASIRVAMRKQEDAVKLDNEEPPPPPSMNINLPANSGRIGKWTVTQEAVVAAPIVATGKVENAKNDDAIMQQWNTVQPVISESEKKLLEQLKGKLKSKPRDSPTTIIPQTAAASNARNVLDSVGKENNQRREIDKDTRRRSRSPAYRGGSPNGSGRRVGGRTRSRTRSRSRGRFRRNRRSRSRSRGGFPARRRRSRSRSRSLRRRSRSRDRRRRFSRSYSRSRTRSKSGSRSRVEKPIVKHAEFRPRVPEKDKDAIKKLTDTKEKKDVKKPKISPTNSLNTTPGKKLPFIGKMPVLKKQTSAQPEGSEQRVDENAAYSVEANNAMTAAYAMQPQQRAIAPTAAQIQMAMMEDAYGNAPPFHPDATGIMVDYDDLMPDPVQFVNIMGQAPPPPPPPSGGIDGSAEADEDDMLPPGIDEIESEEFVQKPLTAPSINSPHKASLPKDLEEALNIIFPGEKQTGEEDDDDFERKQSTGQTQIINDEPVMQAEDLVKEGIHMVSIEETSIAGADDASQMSMNEPLNFAKRATAVAKSPPPLSEDGRTVVAASAFASVNTLLQEQQLEHVTTQNAAYNDISKTVTPALGNGSADHKPKLMKNLSSETVEITSAAAELLLPSDIPQPQDPNAIHFELDDIPQPPDSPTDSEKMRRQEELNDLAMLGIDADDMAAQCI